VPKTIHQDVLENFKKKFKGKIIDWQEKSLQRHYVNMNPKYIVEVARFLSEKQKARFVIATGIDTPRGMEILYHFSFDQLGKILTVRVLLPKNEYQIESLATHIPAAVWIEREIRELFGVKFLNHPDPRHLLLAEDWPEGKYPYRIKNG